MVRQCPLFIAGYTDVVFGTYPPRGSIPHRLLSDLWQSTRFSSRIEMDTRPIKGEFSDASPGAHTVSTALQPSG